MRDATESERQPAGVTRRSLVATGGAAFASLWLGAEWTVIDGVAAATTQQAELRRSGWLQVSDRTLRATVGGRTQPLRLLAVEDVALASQVPALRDHDAAFVVSFSGPTGLEQGTWRVEHSELGTFELFAAPVERPAEDGQQRYEAVIDRTVRIAGVTDDPVPPADLVTVDDARATVPVASRGTLAVPAPAVAAPTVAVTSRGSSAVRGPRPRIRRVALDRAASRRVVVAEAVLADAGAVRSVHALLVSRGRVVARAGGPVRRASRVRLRLRGRRAIASERYELRLTVVERSGRVTRLRRTLNLR